MIAMNPSQCTALDDTWLLAWVRSFEKISESIVGL